jgi:hypothetical protein
MVICKTGLGGITSPDKLVEFLQDFSASVEITGWVNKVSYKYVAEQYLNNKISAATFIPSNVFLTNRSGSCYDLALFSCSVLSVMGHKCDILNFGWNTDIPAVHASCRFWEGEQWYTIHGFLYGRETCILGPFVSLEEFIKGFSNVVKMDTGRDMKMVFVDSFGFEEFGNPTLITKLYPIEKKIEKLEYWHELP